ncbi:MAG: hypothetical protein IPH35_09495 [Rhodoferax sp.]|nr:hypothetical protein [Rhodoferax sp.]
MADDTGKQSTLNVTWGNNRLYRVVTAEYDFHSDANTRCRVFNEMCQHVGKNWQYNQNKERFPHIQQDLQPDLPYKPAVQDVNWPSR